MLQKGIPSFSAFVLDWPLRQEYSQSYWKFQLNIHLIIFLDDIPLMEKTLQKILMSRDTAIFLLQRMGLVLNQKKSVGRQPYQIKFLGMQRDTKTMKLFLPQEKVRKINRKCFILRKSTNRNSGVDETNRSPFLNVSSHSTCTYPIPLSATTAGFGIETGKDLPCFGPWKSGSQTWTTLVGKKLKFLNGRKINKRELNMIIQTDASKICWGSLQQDRHRREMDFSYQYPRASSCLLWHF